MAWVEPSSEVLCYVMLWGEGGGVGVGVGVGEGEGGGEGEGEGEGKGEGEGGGRGVRGVVVGHEVGAAKAGMVLGARSSCTHLRV